jgi:hypothetical protein
MDWITQLGIIASIASIIGLMISFYQIRQANKQKLQKTSLSLSTANGKTFQLKFFYAALVVSLFASCGSLLYENQYYDPPSDPQHGVLRIVAFSNSYNDSVKGESALIGWTFNIEGPVNNSTKKYNNSSKIDGVYFIDDQIPTNSNSSYKLSNKKEK